MKRSEALSSRLKSLTSNVALGKWFNFSKLQFPENRANNSSCTVVAKIK